MCDVFSLYCVSGAVGVTLEQAIAEARTTHERRQSVGYDQEGLDQAARLGFQNAAFETSEEEVPEILEEFFPEDGGHSGQVACQRHPASCSPSVTRPAYQCQGSCSAPGRPGRQSLSGQLHSSIYRLDT